MHPIVGKIWKMTTQIFVEYVNHQEFSGIIRKIKRYVTPFITKEK